MFQERIRKNYESLTPGFRKLADFIMTSTLDAAFLTATELSRRVDVDPATVVRFAQELGYSGYRELSREIKHYVRDQVTATYRKGEEAGTVEQLLMSLVDNSQQNFQYFITTDMAKLVTAVEALAEVNHIWVVPSSWITTSPATWRRASPRSAFPPAHSTPA
jgi:DNA-binding MurR/RpiR family transcriptional regulator